MSDELQGPLDPEQVARDAREAVARHNDEVRARMKVQSRRSFLAAGGAAAAGLAGLGWLFSRRADGNIPWPMRRALQINEGLWRDYYSPTRLAPDFSGKVPLQDRVNSEIGMEEALDAGDWKLQVFGLEEWDDPLELDLADLEK